MLPEFIPYYIQHWPLKKQLDARDSLRSYLYTVELGDATVPGDSEEEEMPQEVTEARLLAVAGDMAGEMKVDMETAKGEDDGLPGSSSSGANKPKASSSSTAAAKSPTGSQRTQGKRQNLQQGKG